MHEPRTVSGRMVLLWTLVGCVGGTFVAVWLALRWVETTMPPEPALVWTRRADWPSPPVKWIVLEREGHAPPFEGRPERHLRLRVTEQERAQIDALAEVARTSQPVETNDDASHFYAAYLNGRYDEAFTLAPKTIKWRFVDPAGEPIPGLAVGAIEIVCAQFRDGVLDDGLRLVFPDLVTDDAGCVYLPVYDTAYRVAVLPSSERFAFDLDGDRWFEFPGRVGAPPPVVVRERNAE